MIFVCYFDSTPLYCLKWLMAIWHSSGRVCVWTWTSALGVRALFLSPISIYTHSRARTENLSTICGHKTNNSCTKHNVHDQLDFSGCRCVFIELAVTAALFARSEILFSYLFRIYHLFSLNDCISTGHIYINTHTHYFPWTWFILYH